jgi:hypothetical protein
MNGHYDDDQTDRVIPFMSPAWRIGKIAPHGLNIPAISRILAERHWLESRASEESEGGAECGITDAPH